MDFGTYKITNDPNLLEKEHGLTTFLKNRLKKIHKKAIKGDKSIIDKIHDLIKKHPKNPQLKNYLSIVYANSGDEKKSFELNHWIIKEHPNYLYGKVNLANEYYLTKKYKKMPEALGKTMSLHDLYPKRTVFHVDEVVTFLVTTIKYFAAINDFDQANIRLEILNELDDYGELYHNSELTIRFHLQLAVAKRFKKEDALRIKVKHKKSSKYIQKTAKIKFTHKEIDLLYENGFEINNFFILDDILALQKDTLIKDLENVLIDSIERYEFYNLKVEQNGYFDEEYTFVLHALFLLKELKSITSLPIVLDVLSQNEDYIDLFISDFLTEDVWSVIYELAVNNLDLLTDFMLKEGLNTYAKSAVNDAVIQMYYHNTQSKEKVMHWVKNVLEYYLNSDINDNVVDSTLIGFLISDLAEMNAVELLPLIKKLYDKNYVDKTVHGDYGVIEKDIKSFTGGNFRPLKSIFKIYNDLIEPSKVQLDNNTTNYNMPNPIIEKPKKIGRNEPCYCGSGKKYKKCCLNK